MNERLQMRQRSRESLITLVFTLFSIFLAYVAGTQGWSLVIIPLIVAELLFIWWAYIRDFQSYTSRAVYLTVLSSVNIIYYGMHAIDFFALIPTLCVFMVLISLYQLRPAIHIVIAGDLVLLVYHFLIRGNFISATDEVARDRAVLQMMSLLILTLLCVYSVYRRTAEEEDLREMDSMVQRAEKIKDDFIVNTSHELRTPIHTIAGMSAILMEEKLSEEVHREVQDIQMTGIELQTIVMDIMDYAALEAGRLEFEPRAYNITSTLNDIMNMTVFQNRQKKLELIFDCDPAIPSLLYGDEQQLRRVINNLIGNAIKFTAQGGVRTSVTFRREAYGVNLIVSVKDTGIGMTEEEQESIFRLFYQADADRNRRVEGMGLGLTISSAIIRKMGGFMTVKSAPGKGSEFTFSIPQEIRDATPCISLSQPNRISAIWYFDERKADESIRDDYATHIERTAAYLGITIMRSTSLTELKRRIRSGQFTHLLTGMDEYQEDAVYFEETALQLSVLLLTDRDRMISGPTHVHVIYKPYNAMTLAAFFNHGEKTPHPLAGTGGQHFVAPEARVLVVDDNLMNLKVVEGLLRKYRIRISAASGGEQALSMIESRDYDFVFMDHMMPGMDGIECFRRIRAKQSPDGYYQRVPVIALTANAIAGSREMFLSEGFNDFVAKPIDNALLDQVLRTYIPEEKQLTEEAAKEKSEPAEPDGVSGMFAAMEGIDMDAAMAYCGNSMEDYRDLAGVYLQTGEKYEKELGQYYTTRDWKNYAVIAHAVKSTSKTLGAMKLSEIAFRCESAAKEENGDLVNNYHQALIGEYRRVRQVLRTGLSIDVPGEEETETPFAPLSAGEWEKVREEIAERLETFETGAYEEMLARYAGYTIQDVPFKVALRDVTEKVEEFDFDGARRALNAVGRQVK